MKKIILGLVAIGLLAGGAAAQSPEKNVSFSLNFGITYDNESEVPLNLTVDARAGFRLGERLQLSPEVMYAFSGDDRVISPGVILNYVARSAFFGGGLVAQFRHDYWDNYSDVAAKFNIGFAWRHVILTAYYTGRFYTDEETDLFGYHQIGVTVGWRF
jgi:hypothetical protein